MPGGAARVMPSRAASCCTPRCGGAFSGPRLPFALAVLLLLAAYAALDERRGGRRAQTRPRSLRPYAELSDDAVPALASGAHQGATIDDEREACADARTPTAAGDS